MEAVEPSFSRIAASNTDPTVGAAVWASGSQVWSGHIGTLTANPRKRAAKMNQATLPVNSPLRSINLIWKVGRSLHRRS